MKEKTNSQNEITTNDILAHKEIGIKSARTIRHYVQKGILPEPRIGAHPRGKGQIGYFPKSVIKKLLLIRKLQAEGYQLEEANIIAKKQLRHAQAEEIRKSFINKLSEEFKSEDNPEGKIDPEELFHTLLLDSASSIIKDEKEQVELIMHLKVIPGYFEMLEGLTNAGINIVLVYEEDDVHILPDFYLGHYIAMQGDTPKPFYVIPLRDTIKEFYTIQGFGKMPEIKLLPNNKVLRNKNGKLIEANLLNKTPTTFVISEKEEQVVGEILNLSNEGGKNENKK